MLISNVRVSLWPGALPSELGCTATAVYVPLASAGETDAELHTPPSAGAPASTVRTTDPPLRTSTVTGVVSLAEPLNEGVVSPDLGAGWLSLTWGEAVLTTNPIDALLPGALPIELDCSANAV